VWDCGYGLGVRYSLSWQASTSCVSCVSEGSSPEKSITQKDVGLAWIKYTIILQEQFTKSVYGHLRWMYVVTKAKKKK
jgi:hypothetical protein